MVRSGGLCRVYFKRSGSLAVWRMYLMQQGYTRVRYLTQLHLAPQFLHAYSLGLCLILWRLTSWESVLEWKPRCRNSHWKDSSALYYIGEDVSREKEVGKGGGGGGDGHILAPRTRVLTLFPNRGAHRPHTRDVTLEPRTGIRTTSLLPCLVLMAIRLCQDFN